MIVHTEKEIKDKVYGLLGPAGSAFREAEIKVVTNNNFIFIKVGAMYESPEPEGGVVGFLIELSEFFGTENINIDNFAHSGCESCDWGSEYGFELIIKPE